MIFEVHVQVLAARCLGAALGVIDQPGTDALASCCSRDHGVLQPCVDQAIPEDIDESDEDSAVAGYHPAEAVLVHELDPVPL